MVAEGDTVLLTYEGGRIHLAVKAEALGDGDMGEQVEVRNLQSDRVVTGTVIGKNKVGVR